MFETTNQRIHFSISLGISESYPPIPDGSGARDHLLPELLPKVFPEVHRLQPDQTSPDSHPVWPNHWNPLEPTDIPKKTPQVVTPLVSFISR